MVKLRVPLKDYLKKQGGLLLQNDIEIDARTPHTHHVHTPTDMHTGKKTKA